MSDAIGREPNDFYKTPPWVTKSLLKVEAFTPAVWEPACGDGAISKVMDDAGHMTISTDLIARGFGLSGRNFLHARELLAPSIVTNPPFKLAQEFVLHSLHLGAEKVAMLLRLAWLEGEARRRALFEPHPPARVWVLSGRPTLWNGSDPNPRDTGGAMAYAWYVWDRAAPAGTRMGWLPARAASLESLGLL